MSKHFKLKNKQHSHPAFTIVELLIVTVVIGILAAISVVAYNGIQNRAYDTQRKADTKSIAQMIGLVVSDLGRPALAENSGCGAGGNGSGWWSANNDNYPTSIRDCLVNYGFDDAREIGDPSGCDDRGREADCRHTDTANWGRYLIAHCNTNGTPSGYVFAHLKSEPEKPDMITDICDDGQSTFSTGRISAWTGCAGETGHYCLNHYVKAY